MDTSEDGLQMNTKLFIYERNYNHVIRSQRKRPGSR